MQTVLALLGLLHSCLRSNPRSPSFRDKDFSTLAHILHPAQPPGSMLTPIWGHQRVVWGFSEPLNTQYPAGPWLLWVSMTTLLEAKQTGGERTSVQPSPITRIALTSQMAH